MLKLKGNAQLVALTGKDPAGRSRPTVRTSARKSSSEKETAELFLLQCRLAQLPVPKQQHRFCERRWRLDFAFLEIRLGIEIEGGVFSGGRHTRGAGYRADLEKYNELAILGWHLLRFLPEQVKSGLALEVVERYFNNTLMED